MTEKPDLQFIMVKDGYGGFQLYGCRGVGKGCPRNKYRVSKSQCEDCLLARNQETLEEFQKRLDGGDA